MKPIEIKISGHTPKTSQEICAEILNTERWPEFEGYSILPGIKNAHFETKTADLLGSRIKVQNTDGSSHVEEIIEWDADKRVVLKFQEFTPPLRHFATHFIETWEFRQAATGINISRSMSMFPTGLFGWLVLLPISRLMKKAFERNKDMLGDG